MSEDHYVINIKPSWKNNKTLREWEELHILTIDWSLQLQLTALKEATPEACSSKQDSGREAHSVWLTAKIKQEKVRF